MRMQMELGQQPPPIIRSRSTALWPPPKPFLHVTAAGFVVEKIGRCECVMKPVEGKKQDLQRPINLINARVNRSSTMPGLLCCKKEVTVIQMLTEQARRLHPEVIKPLIKLLMSSLLYPPVCEGVGITGIECMGDMATYMHPSLGPEVML